MPNVASTIRKQLNVPTFVVTTESPNSQDYNSDEIKKGFSQYPVYCGNFSNFLKVGHTIGKAEPLFKRITDAEIKLLREKFDGTKE
jgi:hypothetical protein